MSTGRSMKALYRVPEAVAAGNDHRSRTMGRAAREQVPWSRRQTPTAASVSNTHSRAAGVDTQSSG